MKFIKDNIHYIIIATILITYVFSFISCNTKHTPTNIDVQILKSDSLNNDTAINKYDADAKLFELSREYNLLNDSFIAVKASRDSAIKAGITNKEKLAIAEFKLLRIREYNRIAAQGNNIKYLRGWINRVLN